MNQRKGHKMTTEKIKSREEIAEICVRLRKDAQSIGFTSGAFDLFHAGHADYLEKAKLLCDILIVGVNSDASVKKYKGDDRPFISEQNRITVIAALESVTYTFLFSERRNQKNIELIKPDLYIKAGDYSHSTLTSKDAVEKWGGRVALIPVTTDISSTAIIDKIGNKTGTGSVHWDSRGETAHMELTSSKPVPALFVDRDGTINEEISYLHEPEKFKLLPRAAEGIKQFQDMGYRIIVMTNQPGIGMGYFSKEDFYTVNRAMLKSLSKHGILIDKIYFCPHSKSEKCSCRKPGQALVERAREELNIDMARSVFVGDKTSDIETGRRAGMMTALVNSGYGGKDEEFPVKPTITVSTIQDAADYFLEKERQ